MARLRPGRPGQQPESADDSYYEDFSATVAEQIWTGLIPVLVDADWSRYLTPPGYPYLFRSMEVGQAMLRYVVDHKPPRH